MEKNSTLSKKIRKAFIFVIPFLLAPGLNGCFLDDITKMMDSFKPYMNILTEKASKPENVQNFNGLIGGMEKGVADASQQVNLGVSAKATGAPKVDVVE